MDIHANYFGRISEKCYLLQAKLFCCVKVPHWHFPQSCTACILEGVGEGGNVWENYPKLFLGEGGGIGNGPNTVSESTASNTELSELFGPHRVPERELSEILSAY